jgi:kynurenine formamidase
MQTMDERAFAEQMLGIFEKLIPIDISIPLKFNGPQPNSFGVEPAASSACEYGDLVGDTRRSGSCNFERVTLIPHCNGTHTECVGHITKERISVRDCLNDIIVRSALVTIEPEFASKCGESYAVRFGDGDRVITRRLIESKVGDAEALIIRTLPNDESKLSRLYRDGIPPYFTNEAMNLLFERDVKHLLVDLPSIDRLYDEGKLSNHRIFWQVEAGKFEINEKTRLHSTVTELIYVPNDLADGEYLLNLQIAPFESDAAPSRPIIFKMKNG